MAREQKIYVFIYLPGDTVAVPAGIFTHYPDNGIGRFAYGLRYQERQNALSVDPVALQLGAIHQDATTNDGLYGSFRDASPDYWGRLVISAELGIVPESLGETDRPGSRDEKGGHEDRGPGQVFPDAPQTGNPGVGDLLRGL